MLRFIFLRETLDECTQLRSSYHYTMDLDVPDLERELTRGGWGESAYDIRSLVDVEVLQK